MAAEGRDPEHRCPSVEPSQCTFEGVPNLPRNPGPGIRSRAMSHADSLDGHDPSRLRIGVAGRSIGDQCETIEHRVRGRSPLGLVRQDLRDKRLGERKRGQPPEVALHRREPIVPLPSAEIVPLLERHADPGGLTRHGAGPDTRVRKLFQGTTSWSRWSCSSLSMSWGWLRRNRAIEHDCEGKSRRGTAARHGIRPGQHASAAASWNGSQARPSQPRCARRLQRGVNLLVDDREGEPF